MSDGAREWGSGVQSSPGGGDKSVPEASGTGRGEERRTERKWEGLLSSSWQQGSPEGCSNLGLDMPAVHISCWRNQGQKHGHRTPEPSLGIGQNPHQGRGASWRQTGAGQHTSPAISSAAPVPSARAPLIASAAGAVRGPRPTAKFDSRPKRVSVCVCVFARACACACMYMHAQVYLLALYVYVNIIFYNAGVDQ